MVDDNFDSNEGIELNIASNNSNNSTTPSDIIPSSHEMEVGIPEENNNVLFTDDLTDRNDEFEDAEYDSDALLVDKQISTHWMLQKKTSSSTRYKVISGRKKYFFLLWN